MTRRLCQPRLRPSIQPQESAERCSGAPPGTPEHRAAGSGPVGAEAPGALWGCPAVWVDDRGGSGYAEARRMCLSRRRLRSGGVRRPAQVIDVLAEVSMSWRDHRRAARGCSAYPGSATGQMDVPPGLRLPRHPLLASGRPLGFHLAISGSPPCPVFNIALRRSTGARQSAHRCDADCRALRYRVLRQGEETVMVAFESRYSDLRAPVCVVANDGRGFYIFTCQHPQYKGIVVRRRSTHRLGLLKLH